MYTRMIALLLAVFAVAISAPVYAAAYYVSPSGSDTNSGSISSPFKTIPHAITAMESGNTRTTFVETGTYIQSGTSITLGSSDSGDQLLAYPGEHPVISGGYQVTSWTQQSSPSGSWSAPFPSGYTPSTDSFSQMPPVVTDDGNWYDCARTPNVNLANRYHTPSAWFFIDDNPAPATWPPDYGTDKSFTFAGTDLNPSIYNGEPTAGIGAWDKLGWYFDPMPIASIDFSTNTVNLNGASTFGFGNNSRYFIYGTKGSLDVPGEFFEDTQNSKLWIIPPSGDNPNDDTVVISESEGPPVIEINGANDVLIEGFQIRDQMNSGRWDNNIGNYAPQNGGVRIDSGSGDAIEDNTFSCLGLAISLQAGATGCYVANNQMYDLCGGAVALGSSNTSQGNAFMGNYIHDTGLLEEAGGGISSPPAPNYVAYNSISMTGNTGISMGDETNASNGFTVMYNTFLHTSQGTDDTGAVYLKNGGHYNASWPEVVAYNSFTDTGGAAFNSSGQLTFQDSSYGVYMDLSANGTMGQSDTQVYGNLFNWTGWGGVFAHEGEYNNVYNNIMANGVTWQQTMNDANEPYTNDFHNNIYYWYDQHDPFQIKGIEDLPTWDDPSESTFADNDYWSWYSPTTYDSTSANWADLFDDEGNSHGSETYATWLSSGSYDGGTEDTGSIQSDPQFMDGPNAGYMLQSTSPALASPISFTQLPFQDMGPKGMVANPLQIACGSSSAEGTWVADEDYSTPTKTVYYDDTNTVTAPNSAPNNIYNNYRYDPSFTYTIPGLSAGSVYTVRLHFAEPYYGVAGRGGTGTGVGSRFFNVSINGTQVLTNFDVYKTAGGPEIADIEQFTAIANSSGQIIISFASSPSSPDQNAMICGIEIAPKILTPVIQIACGSPSAEGTWVADTDYSGGSVDDYYTDTFNVSAPNTAPNSVYQAERYGSFTYTIPNLTPGASYVVRLHLDEDYWGISGRGGGTGYGDRYFNVSINGNSELSNFDIFADCGGAEVADVQQFWAIANSSGQVVIAFSPSSGSPDQDACVSGIEVLQ